jgi:ribosomal-protein-alanine acetyltransferase
VRLRPPEPADVAAVADLERAALGADAWSETAVGAELLGETRVALVAVADGEVVGYVAVVATADTADLTRLAVAPDQRRHGIASALLAAVADRVARLGIARMVLEVAEDNGAAIALYDGVGFSVISRRERYYRSGAAALVMERRLDERGGTRPP